MAEAGCAKRIVVFHHGIVAVHYKMGIVWGLVMVTELLRGTVCIFVCVVALLLVCAAAMAIWGMVGGREG